MSTLKEWGNTCFINKHGPGRPVCRLAKIMYAEARKFTSPSASGLCHKASWKEQIYCGQKPVSGMGGCIGCALGSFLWWKKDFCWCPVDHTGQRALLCLVLAAGIKTVRGVWAFQILSPICKTQTGEETFTSNSYLYDHKVQEVKSVSKPWEHNVCHRSFTV